MAVYCRFCPPFQRYTKILLLVFLVLYIFIFFPFISHWYPVCVPFKWPYFLSHRPWTTSDGPVAPTQDRRRTNPPASPKRLIQNSKQKISTNLGPKKNDPKNIGQCSMDLWLAPGHETGWRSAQSRPWCPNSPLRSSASAIRIQRCPRWHGIVWHV